MVGQFGFSISEIDKLLLTSPSHSAMADPWFQFAPSPGKGASHPPCTIGDCVPAVCGTANACCRIMCISTVSPLGDDGAPPAPRGKGFGAGNGENNLDVWNVWNTSP